MLEIQNLNVSFRTRNGEVKAIRGISLSVAKKEILGIVGESGSGKSVTCHALMRILEPGGEIKAGDIRYSGLDLCQANERELADLRGREISMIFQNPRACLNPIRKVGHQLEDILRRHSQATRFDARKKAISALEEVRINDAEARYNAYPYELSGGMCQRVVIASALACDPKLLIADEPTTGLDIMTQKVVMDLISALIRERGSSCILITHDLGLAAQYCDRIVVMKDGVIVEHGKPKKIFGQPEHHYTRKLVDATPREGENIRSLLTSEEYPPTPEFKITNTALLEVRNLIKTYTGKSGSVSAVRDVSFFIKEGQSVGLVGESGCGKSTISQILARLIDPTSGQIIFEGNDIGIVPAKIFAKDRRRSEIQLVFQDATDSLNPRHTPRKLISEPLIRLGRLNGLTLTERVEELAELVGLPITLLDRFPHQLSGGQKARVGIARAIALEPRLLILDEPTAALDVSIQAIVLNLLVDLRSKMGISYLFVSHDLQVVRLMCEYVIVMEKGEIVEQGRTNNIMTCPQTQYTKALLDAAPNPPKRQNIK